MKLKKHKWNTSTTPFTEEELKTDERPSVLFVGIFSKMYDSTFMVNGFEEAGYQCEKFDWQKVRFAEGLAGMLDRLIGKAKMMKPDIIFLQIQNPDVLLLDAAKELAKDSFVINYTFDVRNSIDWYKDIAPHIGLTLFGDKQSVAELKKEGIENVEYLPCAADYNIYRKLDIRERTDEYGEIVFIGNNTVGSSLKFPQSEQRVEMVEFMRKQFGDRFKAYGPNWGMNSGVVYPHMEVLIYNSAKVAITHNHFIRSGYQSDRALRAMGCGIYTIAQYYPEINKQFNPTVLATWLDFNMLAEETEKALSNDDRRKMIADNGHDWVREQHSWTKRIEQLKGLIEKYRVHESQS
jgi:glycosyltransferase involved in cell wall biosynthesis